MLGVVLDDVVRYSNSIGFQRRELVMDEETTVATAVRLLEWADTTLHGDDETVFSQGFNAGFKRGVEHLTEFLTTRYIDWDALDAEAKESANV